jgi:superfamily I DNA/RNA helicase
MMLTTHSSLEHQNSIRDKTIKYYGPPGTGKTNTLVQEILTDALAQGIRPQDIAFISFTNKAVNTAVNRALATFPQYTLKDFQRFKTLHKYCKKYFTMEIFDPQRCMIDFALENQIIKSSDSRLDDDSFVYNDWSLHIYDKARNMMKPVEEVYRNETYKRESLDLLLRKVQAYNKYKREGVTQYMDFTDMIEKTIDEVNFPPLEILILDEAQDFTPLQWSVVYKMAANANKIYLAGDDDQAIYRWNGSEHKYFTTYFPGQKKVLTQTRRFGKEIHRFSKIIRKGILDSEPKEFLPNPDVKDSVHRYISFGDVDFNKYKGSWYILGRIRTTVNELRMMAKDKGLYFMDNKGNKSFTANKWKAIRSWTKLSNNKTISKEEAINMYKYIRSLSNDLYRKKEFWDQQENHKEYSFEDLKAWCGLTLKDEVKSQEWWHALKRNIKPTEITYVKILLQKYGQEQLDNDPTIIIDTVHSVKGGEADNVLVYFKADYASQYQNKTNVEKMDEKRVVYVAVTRAKYSLHLLSSDYKYNYPIGEDYLTYIEEKRNDQ